MYYMQMCVCVCVCVVYVILHRNRCAGVAIFFVSQPRRTLPPLPPLPSNSVPGVHWPICIYIYVYICTHTTNTTIAHTPNDES
jgi:hypothetical protein